MSEEYIKCPFHDWDLDTGGECDKCGFDIRKPWKENRMNYWLWFIKQKPSKEDIAEFLRNEDKMYEYYLEAGYDKGIMQ